MKSRVLAALTFVSMIVALYGAFIFAPTERTMGIVQRIFYFHLAAAWIALFVALLISAAGSIMYLVRQDFWWDTLASCSAEIAVLFTTIVLLMGSIWAKPVWGIWWTWDARLTSTLFLWMIYVGYLMLRAYIPDRSRRATLSAVFAILGYVDVPVVFMSIRWWRTQHPSPVIGGGEGSGLDGDMAIALVLALAAFTFLYLYLLEKRMAVARAEQEIEYLESVAHSA